MSSTEPTPALSAERVLNRAVESPLVRGGLVIVAGLVTGNLLGFLRVALTAYLLGTHARADSLAVAMGPIDTLNSVVINSIVFAFVPMLTAAGGNARRRADSAGRHPPSLGGLRRGGRGARARRGWAAGRARLVGTRADAAG